jgi:hypothetical protein
VVLRFVWCGDDDMNIPITSDDLSRIDKLSLDREGADPREAGRRRAARGLDIVIGNDVAASWILQLALLTAVNLGVKCFGRAKVHARASDVWSAPCRLPWSESRTLRDAISKLGGTPVVWGGVPPEQAFVVLGDDYAEGRAIRATYDGWLISVGPAREVPRMRERPYCPLAGIGAAALAMSEIFAEFAGISVAAARRTLHLSLWRPDAPKSEDAVGEPLGELPGSWAVFGLGHLGQAYLWALAGLPYELREDVLILLCDDDRVAPPNIETGALLAPGSRGLKTRVAAEWLETRGFQTQLLERRVDENFRRTQKEPVIALAGFDDNHARHWLSEARFERIFDSGLGGEVANFDTIAFHTFPNPRTAGELWLVAPPDAPDFRAVRAQHLAKNNARYQALDAEECGRLLLAGQSIAVPFVGAIAACVVVSESLKTLSGGPTYYDLTLRIESLAGEGVVGRMAHDRTPPIRGLSARRAKPVT